MKCKRCKAPAVAPLPSHNAAFCEECFLIFFTRQVERAIKSAKLFRFTDKILVAVSGGKDSLALLWELDYLGYDVAGLHVDLGIPGSSDLARQVVLDFCQKNEIPIHILKTADEGLPIPLVKKSVNRPVCSICGKIKRYYFNKFAMDNGFDVLATGHNLDDEAARLFANTLRWDTSHLSSQGPALPAENGFLRKVKPLYRLSEYETSVMCFLRSIDYMTAPCPYSGKASFTGHKKLLAELEHKSPGSKMSFYEGFLSRGKRPFMDYEKEHGLELKKCSVCGYPTSMDVCGVCRVKDAVSRKMAVEAEDAGDQGE